jgi:outer membrane protein assembly factor BamB
MGCEACGTILDKISGMVHVPRKPLSRFSPALVFVACAGVVAGAADWPHWRGPYATGVADEAPPTRWTATENVLWKAPIGGLGVSTPIVSGERIFVTSQVGAGVRRAGNHPRLVQGGNAAAAGEQALGTQRTHTPDAMAEARTVFLIEAFDRASGRRVWEQRVEASGEFPGVHDKHNMATPSPVTDGRMVYAWFGTGQLVALTVEGTIAWQRHLGREIAPFDIQWGHSSSPVLHEDLLLLLCDQPASSYLLALDKRTGKERWTADRGKGRFSYSTPLVVRTPSRVEVIVNSNERVDAYDAATGALLWHVGDSNRFPVPSPVFHDGIIYMSRGYRSGPYFAVRPGGSGDVSGSHVLWLVPTGAPYVSSLVYDDGRVYMANDVGVLTAVNAKTGERVWQERIDGVFSASPVAAGGHIYFASENGETIVVKSAATPSVVAKNSVGERTIASPAIAAGRLYLRTDGHLFAIGRR